MRNVPIEWVKAYDIICVFLFLSLSIISLRPSNTRGSALEAFRRRSWMISYNTIIDTLAKPILQTVVDCRRHGLASVVSIESYRHTYAYACAAHLGRDCVRVIHSRSLPFWTAKRARLTNRYFHWYSRELARMYSK